MLLRHVRPAVGRSRITAVRRAPRPWSRARRTAFLHQLTVQDTLEQALAVAHVRRDEAYAERARDRAFARAWDRCVAQRMARLPEELLDHVMAVLRSGPDAKEATVRQAASIGQWLLEKCLPALSGTTTSGGTSHAELPGGRAARRAPGRPKVDRAVKSRIGAVRIRISEKNAA